MTFKIFAIELTDFKCFEGEHHWEFPQAPGLYYLTGRNLFNKRLGANGCGKTTIIDAIEWALYGKTSRGLRASDVIAWGKKSTTVSISLMVGDSEVEITRSQNPNRIFINSKPASQEDIINLIRLNQEAFNASVVLPQFGSSFFDLTPTEKLTMFSQVMNLDYWLEKSKQADDEASAIESKINGINSFYQMTNAKLENGRALVKDLKKRLKDHKTVVASKIKELRYEQTKCEKIIAKQLKLVKKREQLIKDVQKEYDTVVDALNECATDFTKVNDEFYGLTNIVENGQNRIQELCKDIEAVTKLGDVCPTCRQPIDSNHIESHQSKIEKQIKKIKKAINQANLDLEDISAKREQLRGDTFELKKLQDGLKDKYDGHKSDKRDAERTVEQMQADIKRLDREVAKLKSEDDPYSKIIDEKRSMNFVYKSDIKKLNEQLQEQEAELAAVKYWVNGFKSVRLFIIEEALTSLEIEVNNMLASFGLADWKITFDVERENKSGGVTKGFTVFIQSPKHDEPVRYEAWSGGETQRLRLAGDLGLANLIMEQAGYTNHIELIDEPSEHMSPEGIEDMVTTIYERAQQTGKQIWLVEHNTMGFGEFAGTLTSIMDEQGHARLEYKGV